MSNVFSSSQIMSPASVVPGGTILVVIKKLGSGDMNGMALPSSEQKDLWCLPSGTRFAFPGRITISPKSVGNIRPGRKPARTEDPKAEADPTTPHPQPPSGRNIPQGFA